MSNKIVFTLYTKDQCCLCEQAKKAISRVAKDYPIDLLEIDITTEPTVFDKYRYIIPVLWINGKEVFRGKIAEFWIRRELKNNFLYN